MNLPASSTFSVCADNSRCVHSFRSVLSRAGIACPEVCSDIETDSHIQQLHFSKSISISSLKGSGVDVTLQPPACRHISVSCSKSRRDRAKSLLHCCFEASNTSMILSSYCLGFGSPSVASFFDCRKTKMLSPFKFGTPEPPLSCSGFSR